MATSALAGTASLSVADNGSNTHWFGPARRAGTAVLAFLRAGGGRGTGHAGGGGRLPSVSGGGPVLGTAGRRVWHGSACRPPCPAVPFAASCTRPGLTWTLTGLADTFSATCRGMRWATASSRHNIECARWLAQVSPDMVLAASAVPTLKARPGPGPWRLWAVARGCGAAASGQAGPPGRLRAAAHSHAQVHTRSLHSHACELHTQRPQRPHTAARAATKPAAVPIAAPSRCPWPSAWQPS